MTAELINPRTGQPLKVGDKIAGGRLGHYYAEVEEVADEYIAVRYCGECRTVRLPYDVAARAL